MARELTKVRGRNPDAPDVLEASKGNTPLQLLAFSPCVRGSGGKPGRSSPNREPEVYLRRFLRMIFRTASHCLRLNGRSPLIQRLTSE